MDDVKQADTVTADTTDTTDTTDDMGQTLGATDQIDYAADATNAPADTAVTTDGGAAPAEEESFGDKIMGGLQHIGEEIKEGFEHLTHHDPASDTDMTTGDADTTADATTTTDDTGTTSV